MWDRAKTKMILLIADHLDWKENEGEHLFLLQSKLNAYLDYIESGQLFATYLWAKGVPIIISVDGKYPLSAEAEKFYTTAKKIVADLGFSLEFTHSPSRG